MHNLSCSSLCRYTAICLLASTLSSCSWFPESTFMLSPQSRLPSWIELRNLNRTEITVRVDFIAWPWKSYARITVLDHHGRVLERLNSDSLVSEPQLADGTPARGKYPSYDVIAVRK